METLEEPFLKKAIGTGGRGNNLIPLCVAQFVDHAANSYIKEMYRREILGRRACILGYGSIQYVPFARSISDCCV